MSDKTLLQTFNRYEPANTEEERILSEALQDKLYIDKANKKLEVFAKMPRLVDKDRLYELEFNIARAYELTYLRIRPMYKKELFSIGYLDQIFKEASARGCIARGFFFEKEARISQDRLIIEVGLSQNAMAMLEKHDTAGCIREIINDEFGFDIPVELIRLEPTEDPYLKERNDHIAAVLKSAQNQAAARPQTYDAPDSPDKAELGKKLAQMKSSLYEEEPYNEFCDNGTCKVGKFQFDISSVEGVYGDEVDPTAAIPIREIDREMKSVTVLGTVFGTDSREMRGKKNLIVTFYVTDGDSTVKVKQIMPVDDAGPLLSLKEGTALAVSGSVSIDTYDQDFQLKPRAVGKIKKLTRPDKAENKRVELHLHTQLSMLDALIPPDVAVNTAVKWGHKAIAITDHGNVQAFPIAQNAAAKHNWVKDENGKKKFTGKIKVIYGMEGYFHDDTSKAVYGGQGGSFDDEIVMFDIETTGLSVQTCRIIEIGAVLVKDNEVIDRFNTFVDPEGPVPSEITKLTGIDDTMVKGAPCEKDAVKAFLDFAGDRLLVAHNAGFDISFILRAANRQGLQFSPRYLDTVAMSRYTNPELKNHKLDTIAEHFDLGDFNHHRASDDAEMLAMIFFKMANKLRQEGVYTIDAMNSMTAGAHDSTRRRPKHIILLAANKAGLKNLYKIVSKSNLEHFYRFPQIPKSVLDEHREGLIIGSACSSGELYEAILDGMPDSRLEEIASYYDYLEIQPLTNNQYLIKEEKVSGYDQLKQFNLKIIELGKKLNKPVCATCDAHVLDREDEIGKRILYHAKHLKGSDYDIGVFFRTTDEMLAEFDYLDEKTRIDVVINNPNAIADRIDFLDPIPAGNFPPKIEGADEDLKNLCYSNMHRLYGDNPPKIVADRLEKELGSIIKNGFGVLYIIAQKLVKNSESKGYLVGSRGSVGSSFVATMSDITEVNPLPPHYRCPSCKYSEFVLDGSVGSGFDMPVKMCPKCGTEFVRDGHDIPFETFLGFHGEKSPDIDLNFSGDVQGDAHKYTEELFGEKNVFRAGTLGTIADKTAFGLYVSKYVEEKQIPLRKAEIQHLVTKIVGVKRTTGQHPGGIIVVPKECDVYDFTPIQHPADDPKSDTVTTHFAFEYLHDTLLKLDILGHDVPTKYKTLERYTNTNILETPLSDPKVMQLFTSTEPLGIRPEDIDARPPSPSYKPLSSGTLALPEFGTKFVRQMLEEAQPTNFSDLLQISGLSHGTDVWLDNAQKLIHEGTCTISNVIGTRDSIMTYLMYKGLDPSYAFEIMEKVRKGKGKQLDGKYFDAMRENNVPEWYIESCLKIKYMFPKAHAAAYVISAIRLGYYKVYYPLEFYAAYFTVAPDGFNAELAIKGKSALRAALREHEEKSETTARENDEYAANQIVLEAVARGIKFLPVKLGKSHEKDFLPEDGKIRLPYSALPGLGDTAACNIAQACREHKINSVLDLQQYSKISKAVTDILRQNGVLDGMDETNQISMFSLISE